MFVPTREEFIAIAAHGDLIPVCKEILADRLTPVSAFERLTAGEENGLAFLLESVVGGERVRRYSFLGHRPSTVFRSKGRDVFITENGVETHSRLKPGEDPLTLLKERMNRHVYVPMSRLPSFCGGAVGFFGYDVVRFFEDLPDDNPDEMNVEDAYFLFTDTLLIFDHVKRRMKVVCNAPVNGNPGAAYDLAVIKIEAEIALLRTPVVPDFYDERAPKEIKVKSLFPREQYEAAVERCRQYILAGDAFQIVLAQRFEVEFTAPHFNLYRALRSVNPSPYMFYLSLGENKLIGSSPETLAKVEGGTATLRPIAGSRPRGKDEAEDIALEQELLADAKEVAEHIMLVDLSRNDLGRVCEYGTIYVHELMVVERYSHIMHIVSDVRGTLQAGKDEFDLLRSAFPHGTVSGAPKVRAMEIIDEQEPTRRGFYAGSVGYFSYSGDMDMAIALRTMMTNGNIAYLQAGGGLVADSIPANEYQECINKAKALVTAIQLAENGLE